MIAHVIHPRCKTILHAKTIESANPAGFELEEFYAEMGCDIVEVVPNPTGLPFMVWVDEEGRYASNPEVNSIASILTGTVIVGTAIITDLHPFSDMIGGDDDA